MNLSASIIANRLVRQYQAVIFGGAGTDLVLPGPEFYIDNSPRLCANHLYLATVEHLAHRPVIEENVVLVCIGENPRLNYYKEKACVILIRKKVDFFSVFQTLQDIFLLFSSFETKLLALFCSNPSVQGMLDCAWPLFEKPITVLDDSWQYIASANGSENKQDNLQNTPRMPLELDRFLTFLSKNDLSMNRKGAFPLQVDNGCYLCVNLFDSKSIYIGCLFIELGQDDCSPGDIPLVEYLAHMIERVIEITPSLVEGESRSLVEPLQSIMNELPLSNNQKRLLKNASNGQRYVCISVHYLVKFSALPVSYLCTAIGNLLSESILFDQNNTILGVIPQSVAGNDSEKLSQLLTPILKQMQLCVGISNAFSDLYLLRTYYFQAEAAIENGLAYAPGNSLYSFSSYALEELITNSLGSLPLESYFPEGFSSILEHDGGGGISYLDTLQVFLEENMSYANASRRLFVHRSTLIERLNRIERVLSLDLKSPDHRLQLQILMKALQMEKKLRRQ